MAKSPRGVPSGCVLALTEFGPFDALSDVAHAEYIAGFAERAVWMCRAWRTVTRATGDITTTHYLQYIEGVALQELGRHAEAVAVARGLLEEVPTGDGVWRAKALAIVAESSTRLEDHVEATRALAEAEWVLRSVPAGSYGHLSASMAVGLALRSVGLLEQAEVILMAIRGGGSPEIELLVIQELAVTSAYWGSVLRLLGRDRDARVQDALSLSRGLHLQRLARATGNRQMQARGEVVESFAALSMSDPEMAVARARAAAERFAARRELVESHLLHLVLARGAAAEGRHGVAREHLAALVSDAEAVGRDVWADVGRAALAEILVEQLGDHDSVDLWRSVARGMGRRLWSEHEARFAAIQDRHHVRELRAESHRIGQAVLTDPLTGLGNRRLLDELTQRRSITAAVFIDIDEFKDINDRFSHAVGDNALRAMARILRDQSRPTDDLIRYGGDEFVVVPSDGSEGASRLAERILLAVHGTDWSQLAEGLALTVSVGVAAVGPHTPDALVAADAAMLSAKRSGRDRVLVHTGTRPAEARDLRTP